MYPRRHIEVTTAPTVEPVTLTEAKAWLKLDTSDDDSLITDLIKGARQAAEDFTRRAFITQTVTLTLDLQPSNLNNALGEGMYELPVSELYGTLPNSIELPRQPIQAINSVTTYALDNTSSVFANSNYILANSRLSLNFGVIWPVGLRRTNACVISCKCGYGDTAASVPEAIKNGIKMHLLAMYDGRIATDLPPTTQNLYRQYRVMDGLRG